MTASDDLHARARAFWARHTGVAIDHWGSGATLIVDSPRPMVSVVTMTDRALVWCPPELRARVAGADPHALVDLDVLTATFDDVIDKPVGSAHLAYLPPRSRPDAMRDSLVTTERPPPDLADFLRSCPSDDVHEAGLAKPLSRRCWVARSGSEITALVTYEVWDDTVAHLLALTSPAHRGKGWGRRAATAACADLQRDSDLLLQWRVSVSNPASLALGRSVGFVPLGRQTTIDLRNQGPGPTSRL